MTPPPQSVLCNKCVIFPVCEVWSKHFRTQFFSLYLPHLAVIPHCPLQNSFSAIFTSPESLPLLEESTEVLCFELCACSLQLFIAVLSTNLFSLSCNLSLGNKESHMGLDLGSMWVKDNSHEDSSQKFCTRKAAVAGALSAQRNETSVHCF